MLRMFAKGKKHENFALQSDCEGTTIKYNVSPFLNLISRSSLEINLCIGLYLASTEQHSEFDVFRTVFSYELTSK